MQRAKGKVKMPRAYWRKKKEAKLRLLNESRTALTSLAAPSESGLPNGTPASRVQDTGGCFSSGGPVPWSVSFVHAASCSSASAFACVRLFMWPSQCKEKNIYIKNYTSCYLPGRSLHMLSFFVHLSWPLDLI